SRQLATATRTTRTRWWTRSWWRTTRTRRRRWASPSGPLPTRRSVRCGSWTRPWRSTSRRSTVPTPRWTSPASARPPCGCSGGRTGFPARPARRRAQQKGPADRRGPSSLRGRSVQLGHAGGLQQGLHVQLLARLDRALLAGGGGRHDRVHPRLLLVVLPLSRGHGAGGLNGLHSGLVGAPGLL